MDKIEAIEIVKKYRQLLKQHFLFDSIYLFGSYANDSFHKDSDIDVAVVVEQMKGDFFTVVPLLWKVRREVDDRIEPILIEKDFDDADFLSEIRRNGIEVS